MSDRTPLTTAHMSVSLDGFVAGPDQSFDNPIGRGGMELHTWHFDAEKPGHDVDARWTAALLRPRGAYAPVFVLTHHEHEPVEMSGGTTFYFVTGGIGAALTRAREIGNGDVDIAGGASAVRQALAAGELDELTLDMIPVLLGRGECIFDGSFDTKLEISEAEHSPWATHVRYRVLH